MSGWTAMTVHPPKALSGDTKERAEEMIEDGLQEMYDENAGGYADRTVQLPRGEVRHTEDTFTAKSWAKEVFGRIPAAKWVTIVSANDTSDSGAGEVYKIEDGDVVAVDKYVGYEGAKGRDVTGYIDDEYRLASYASFEA